MGRRSRSMPVARLLIAVALAAVAIGGLPGRADARLARWTGGIDLYQSGTFTTQQTWLWCTAADVQIIRNIADHQRDHSRASQQRYFDAMRRHNRYAIPVSDGVDPAGWAWGLRHYVDGRYRLVASSSFKSALRSAVRNLRLTGLPVGITVSHGNHAWILTGFTATADPAVTGRFTVTSVRVVGPLWGLQSRSYGYDMRPDTKLTARQLRGFFTPWHYAGVRMAWESDWVSIQPVATAADRAQAASASSKHTASTTSKDTATSTPKPTPTSPAAAGRSPAASPSASPSPAPASAGSADPPFLALVAPGTGSPSASPLPLTNVSIRDPSALDLDAGLAVLMVVILVAGGAGIWMGIAHRGRTR